MTFIDYYKIILKNKIVFLITLAAFLLASVIFTYLLPSQYEGSINLSVSPISKNADKDVPYYEFDGYYAIQAAQYFTSTIAGWIKSPDVVIDVYQKAGVDLEVRNIKSLSKIIKTTTSETVLSTNVGLTMVNNNKDDLSKLLDSASKVITGKVDAYNNASSEKVNFNLLASSPVLIEIHPNWTLNILIGLLAGLLFGVIFSFIAHAAKKVDEN